MKDSIRKSLEERQAELRARNEAEKAPKPKAADGRFQPGESRPAGPGRPHSPLPLTVGPVVRRRLAEIDTKDPRQRQKIERIIDTLFAIATDPKAPTACTKAAEVLLDRAWGKPVQSIEQTVSFKSREEELEFIKETLGLRDHGHGTESVN